MVDAAETFGVDLVDILGAGWARGEPPVGGDHLDAADRRVIARRMIEDLVDGFAGQLADPDLLRRELRRHDAVLVSRPRRPVDAGKRSAGTFFAAETQRSIEQSVDEPFETDWN